MRIVAPREVSVIHRAAAPKGKPALVVTVMCAVPFDRPTAFASEAETWRIVGGDVGRSTVLDHWLPKAQAEVIVTGSCHAEELVPTSHVRVVVGGSERRLIDKRLEVYGERRWTLLGATEPEPFRSMPIDLRHAYGGAGFAANPEGKGFRAEGDGRDVTLVLPNVEDARQPFSPDSESNVAASLATRRPDRGFCVTAPDQRVRGFFEGNEQISVENMHPHRPILETRLSGVRARCFSTNAAGALDEIRLDLDTIHLFPHRERVLLAFRGVRELRADEDADAIVLVAALDDPLDDRRPLDHFRSVLAMAGTLRARGVTVVHGEALLPRSLARSVQTIPRVATPPPIDAAMRALRQELETLAARPVEDGADPSLVPALSAWTNERASSSSRGEVKDAAREEHAAAMRTLGAEAPNGPPTFSAEEELARLERILREGPVRADFSSIRARVADPSFRVTLLEIEHRLRLRYRLTAHLRTPGPSSRAPRQRVDVRALLERSPRARRDFSGADLDGQDLSGLDLEGAFLERASLRGANLTGAILKNAVLSHANLEGATFDGAHLESANLGGVRADKASFVGAMLVGAIVHRGSFREADLSGANLSEVRGEHVDARAARFVGARGEGLVLIEATLEHACLRAARFVRSHFVACRANDTDWTAADLACSTFTRSSAARAVFRDVNAPELTIEESTFQQADFTRATLLRACFRGAVLEHARLGGANLRKSDLSGADLRDADLTNIVAAECLAIDTDLSNACLTGANLMLAILHRAVLRGADLSRTNLFSADLTATVCDDRTSFSESNLKRAMLAGVTDG